MGKIQRFEDLEAWQAARRLCSAVYAVSKTGDLSRDFGLRDQIQRASVSVVANIAEGFESRTTALFIDFLGRAKASAGEVRAELYIAHDAGYLQDDELLDLSTLASNASSCISGLMRYLDRSRHALPFRAQPGFKDKATGDNPISLDSHI